jgi:CheY-like chemotaxis protein
MRLKTHFDVEAVHGVLAERLNVDVATAQLILDGHSLRTSRPVDDIARAVLDGSLTLTWRGEGTTPADPGPDVEHLDVLYIEDQETNVALMRRIFSRWPTMHLDTTFTGGGGLEHVREHPPDLVLLDGNLPDIDGTEVLRRLRRDPATADLPVIVVSADTAPERIAALMAAGANEYVTKPFSFEHLDRLINELTTAARSVRDAERS